MWVKDKLIPGSCGGFAPVWGKGDRASLPISSPFPGGLIRFQDTGEPCILISLASSSREKHHPWKAAERYTDDPEALALRGKAMEVSREAARILKKKYGAKRVVLFGSLAWSSMFVPTSDIDLYAEGIRGSLFFEAEAELKEIAKDFRVDLVETKECPSQLLREIEDEGIE